MTVSATAVENGGRATAPLFPSPNSDKSLQAAMSVGYIFLGLGLLVAGQAFLEYGVDLAAALCKPSDAPSA